jgi:hypothetical protein
MTSASVKKNLRLVWLTALSTCLNSSRLPVLVIGVLLLLAQPVRRSRIHEIPILRIVLGRASNGAKFLTLTAARGEVRATQNAGSCHGIG